MNTGCHCFDRLAANSPSNSYGKKLRDEFAMAALTGLLANEDRDADASGYALDAYMFADAMLKARESLTTPEKQP